MHTKLTALLALLVVVGAFAATAAAQTHTVVPSKARAVHDVKAELVRQYIELLDTSRSTSAEMMPKARVGCDRLSDTLYRCTWMGKAPPFYTIFGNAKVRFYKYGTDVTLYGVKCYLDPSAALDYCHQ